MDADLLFTICNRAVLPAWLLLLLAPRWAWTEKLIFHAWIPALLALAYMWCFVQGWPGPEDGNFSTLPGVMAFFQAPWFALAGWIHYLAFDLFVGAWEVRDAQRRGVNHLLVAPCLFFTLMAGPVGLLLYFIVRYFSTRALTTVEATA